MSGPRGYHTYRGRTSRATIVMAVVMILVILLSAGAIFLQEYLVYDENGKAHFQAFEQEQTPAEEEEEPLNLTIQPAQATEVRALCVSNAPLSVAAWQTAQATAQQVGCTAVVVSVKSGGHVYMPSQTAVSGAEDLNGDTHEALKAITDSDWYAVARMSCFLDPLASGSDVEGMGLKNTGGFLFYDGENQNWLDPAKSAARQYLCTLAKEAAEKGFDELLLTDVTYPTVGKLNKIDYGDTMKAENLAAFLREMRAALAEYDVKLSVELPEPVVETGSDHVAGLLLSELAPLVDRIYAPTTLAKAESLSAAVREAGKDTTFVPELSQAPEGELSGSFLLDES